MYDYQVCRVLDNRVDLIDYTCDRLVSLKFEKVQSGKFSLYAPSEGDYIVRYTLGQCLAAAGYGSLNMKHTDSMMFSVGCAYFKGCDMKISMRGYAGGYLFYAKPFNKYLYMSRETVVWVNMSPFYDNSKYGYVKEGVAWRVFIFSSTNRQVPLYELVFYAGHVDVYYVSLNDGKPKWKASLKYETMNQIIFR